MQFVLQPLLLLLSFVKGKPTIHRTVKAELEKGADGVIMVSFEAAMVKDAYSPAAVLSAMKRWKRCAADLPLSKFVGSGQFAEARGEFVFTLVQERHAEARKLLHQLIPKEAILTSIPIANLFLLRNLPGVYEQLKDLSGVLEISTNLQFKIPQETKEVTRLKVGTSVQWNVNQIGAPQVWQKGVKGHSQGEGIVIGIADTGVSFSHPNLLGNYRGNLKDGRFEHNYNWWDGVREVVVGASNSSCPVAGEQPCDDDGHGTHCTSTAGGVEGFGVAPGTKWIGCRNMQAGFGSTLTYLSCLNFFLAPHDLEVSARRGGK